MQAYCISAVVLNRDSRVFATVVRLLLEDTDSGGYGDGDGRCMG